MTTFPLGNNVNLPATPPSYYIGVNAAGTQPAMGQNLNTDVFGVAVPASLSTFEFTFDTSSCPSAETCSVVFLWSFDGGATYIAVPGAGGGGWPGGTYTNKQGVVTGVRQLGPDAIQQSPYPDHFIVRVTDCPSGMGPLKSVALILV